MREQKQPEPDVRSDRQLDRREVLQSAAALPLVGLAPGPGPNPDHCLMASRWVPNGDNRSLVVLEFNGGNDGLNTLIPIEDPAWRRARPRLSGVRQGAHKLGDGFALHPNLGELQKLFKDGLAAVVHGVGYPNSSRSHFKSRDVWHTADVDYSELKVDTTGWLGRAVDVLAESGAAVPGLSVGSLQVPLLLKAKDIVVPSLNRIEDYQVLVSGGPSTRDARRAEVVDLVQKSGRSSSAANDLRSFLGGVAKGAVANAEKLRAALSTYRPKATYPRTALGRKLQLLARIIISGFGTQLFHVNFAGFDTHASQLASHANLMRQFSEAVAALVRDLDGHGKLGDVMVMVHSEFGRRLAQNKSRGTDHGKAGPMFFFGGDIQPGRHGQPPSLTDLDGGDPVPTADFRSLYATALRFLAIDPGKVLAKPAEFPGLRG